MRELVQSLDETKDIGIGVLGIKLKHEQFFYVSEFGLLFDELLEDELVLFETDVKEI